MLIVKELKHLLFLSTSARYLASSYFAATTEPVHYNGYPATASRRTCMLLLAFFTDGFENSKNLTLKSFAPETSICCSGWKTRAVTSYKGAELGFEIRRWVMGTANNSVPHYTAYVVECFVFGIAPVVSMANKNLLLLLPLPLLLLLLLLLQAFYTFEITEFKAFQGYFTK